MPTDEWFKENPKISAYISPNLNQKLSEWMKNRGVKKVSQALTTILESYLEVNQDSPNIESSETDRLRIVEQKLESLSQEVRSLTERNEKNNQRVVQTELFLVEPLEETLPDNEEIAPINTEQPIKVVKEIQDRGVGQTELIKYEVWTTQQVNEVLGIGRKKLEGWKRENTFPKIIKEHTILKWAGKQIKPPFSNLWEVKKLDSADPKTITAYPESDASDF